MFDLDQSLLEIHHRGHMQANIYRYEGKCPPANIHRYERKYPLANRQPPNLSP